MGRFVPQRGLSSLDPEIRADIQKRLVECMDYFYLLKGEFAEALGAEGKSSAGWFGKDAKTPQLQTLLNLAEKFGISLHWLLLGEGRKIRRTKTAIAAAKREREAGKRRHLTKSRALARLPRTVRKP